MAAKPIPQSIKDDVLTEWRLGQLSQQAIAEKYGVSKGVVNKICKDVPQDVAPIVTAGVQYRQALHAHDDRMVTAVEKTVDTISARLEWLNEQALKNVKQAMGAGCENQSDFRSRALTINAAKETLVGKTPDTAIQINNQNTAPITKVEWEIVEHTPTKDTPGLCPTSESGQI